MWHANSKDIVLNKKKKTFKHFSKKLFNQNNFFPNQMLADYMIHPFLYNQKKKTFLFTKKNEMKNQPACYKFNFLTGQVRKLKKKKYFLHIYRSKNRQLFEFILKSLSLPN